MKIIILLCCLIPILFLLRLANIIHWEWTWVLIPIWMSIGAILTIGYLCYLLFKGFDDE